jgi:hypothetical protein
MDATLDNVSDAIESCIADPVSDSVAAQETEQDGYVEELATASADAIETEELVAEKITGATTNAESVVDQVAIEEATACLSGPGESDAPEHQWASAATSGSSPALLEEIIATNTAVLQQVVEHMSQVRTESFSELGNADASRIVPTDNNADLIAEIEKLGQQIDDLYTQLDDAQSANSQLKTELAEARTAVVQPVETVAASDASGPLTWEQRKEQMLKEMEEDSFDAESFVETIQASATTAVEAELLDLDPQEYVVQLNLEFDRAKSELKRRDEEVAQLQNQLQNQSSGTSGSLTAETAIEDLVDVDSLLKGERERLQTQQQECEERLRESEIATSLERAKLSRERRELARQNAELEEQLIHVRRENEADLKSGGKGSRRWLAMLGLSED